MKTDLTRIDTRLGTDNHPAYSNGNTLPYTGVPFGMNYFLPQTTHEQGAWFFNPNLPIFQGIRLTHQPSPWIGDFSWCLLTPLTDIPTQEDLYFRQSSYRIQEAIFQPHYLALTSERYQIHTEVTPSLYGAFLRFRGPSELALALHCPNGLTELECGETNLHFHILDQNHTDQQDFPFYLHFEFDQAITRTHWLGQDLILEFDSPILEARLGTSFISPDLAKSHLPKASFEEMKEKAGRKWQELMDRFEILDTGGEDRTFFDHCLYRSLLFPQTCYEVTPEGKAVHRDFAHNRIQEGKYFTSLGFWDLFRTTFPLYSLVYPEIYQEFLEGFLSHYRDTGFLPKWLAPDERGMMPGTLIDGVIADAIQKGLASDLHTELFEAMLDTARKEDPNGHYGRRGAKEYKELGYLSTDYHESVSHTIDFSYSDFCIAQTAQLLGKEELAKEYAQSSLSYRTLFDPETGYIRAKDKKGHFRPDFSPISWGRDYAECSAIQATLGALHDIEGLKQLFGGEEGFTHYLTRLATQAPHYEVTGYGYEIHEMSEMAQAPFGQIAISNQPSFHIPYLFRYSQHPEYTSILIQALRKEAFQPSFQAYPGDEDNGSLSSWYIWSVLGLYPTCPGKPVYDLGIPLFKHLRLYLPQEKKWLHIHSTAHTAQAHFLQDVFLDGKRIDRVSHQELLKAEKLDFHLSWLPKI